MIEILIVISLCRKIAEIAKSKGRAATGYVLLLILFWLGGEFCGAIFGAVATDGQGGILLYVFALVGAAVGAGIVFMIVNSLPPVSVERDRYDRDLGHGIYDDFDRRHAPRLGTPCQEDRPASDAYQASDEGAFQGYRPKRTSE
jgi:hypothetical protein